MSKIYEALKKAEQDRERTRPRPSAQPIPTAEPKEYVDPAQEEYQKLRASLVSLSAPSGLHSILITAARHGEGTTTVALGLAAALTRERDSRVLLVEANVRRPVLSALLPVPTSSGLVDFAAGRAAPESIATPVEGVNFSVVIAGVPPLPTINLEVINALLDRLRPQFDFIIIDAPPVNSYADASVLAAKVDGVILVVEADRTPVADAETAKRQLDKVGGRILGVVLNRRRSYIPAFLESIL